MWGYSRNDIWKGNANENQLYFIEQSFYSNQYILMENLPTQASLIHNVLWCVKASLPQWKEKVILVVITGIATLVGWYVVKSLLFIWRSGTRRWNLRVPDLQISCRALSTLGAKVVSPANGCWVGFCGRHVPLLSQHNKDIKNDNLCLSSTKVQRVSVSSWSGYCPFVYIDLSCWPQLTQPLPYLHHRP